MKELSELARAIDGFHAVTAGLLMAEGDEISALGAPLLLYMLFLFYGLDAGIALVNKVRCGGFRSTVFYRISWILFCRKPVVSITRGKLIQ